MEEVIGMSWKEIDRFAVLQQVQNKQLTQKRAAKLLGLTDRQVRNLLKSMTLEGVKGVISKRRGAPGNHRKPNRLRARVLSLMASKYQDFGPTFASEKLSERDGIEIHPETLRLWMIEEGLWVPKQKKRKVHPPRERRDCFGELIQVDGSHHRWFGSERPKAVLLVFIDDATSRVTALHFCQGETVNDYFLTLESHLKEYGVPRAIYSDRLQVFKGTKNLSQFQRALKSLEVESILAQSPQAKGRVERVNRTLQDRLIKELALEGITSIEDANQFLEYYTSKHNEKFAQEPQKQYDAHRAIGDADLDRLLCRYEERTLSKDYVFQFHNRFYKVTEGSSLCNPKGVKVEVRETLKGPLRVFWRDEELTICPLDFLQGPAVREPLHWPDKVRPPVDSSHPWKRLPVGGKSGCDSLKKTA